MSETRGPELALALKRPFAEQVAFFRGKLGNLVPTAKWDELWKAQHDRAFMVAGAAKADLLADLAGAVDKAIAEGETLEQFRKRFRQIVTDRGWHGWTGEGTKAGEAWRTRVIYETNLITSYSAGRLEQLRAGGYRYWMYKHSDSRNPRPHHRALDGVVLPADDPFWQTHYPPNGWGCRCRAVGVDGPRSAQRLGGNFNKPLPRGWNTIDPKTGEPVGIDKGWGYMPGGTATSTVSALASKLNQLPPAPSVAVIQDWLKADAFARWYAKPQGSWPLVRLPADDLERMGAKAGVSVGMLSAETAGKQLREHPELLPAEYAAAQGVVDAATNKALDGNSMIYVREMPEGGYALVVKVTQSGRGLWVTSLRRLSRDEAAKDSEVRRLLRKENR